jgi:hypothetical protein
VEILEKGGDVTPRKWEICKLRKIGYDNEMRCEF